MKCALANDPSQERYIVEIDGIAKFEGGLARLVPDACGEPSDNNTAHFRRMPAGSIAGIFWNADATIQ